MIRRKDSLSFVWVIVLTAIAVFACAWLADTVGEREFKRGYKARQDEEFQFLQDREQ